MDGAHVVVFGDGEEAVRKIRLLEKTPVDIRQFADASVSGARDALKGAAFSIVAVADDDLADVAIAMVREAGVPLNAVDRPEHCDFTVPSILDRGDLVAAIGSGGAAPVLAKSVRTRLEALLPANLGELAAAARSFRPAVKSRLENATDRRKFWERALTGPAVEAALGADAAGLRAYLEDALEAFVSGATAEGIVHIVGAGPGDPELLTLKAFRLIQEADVVFHDRLVSDEIMDLVRRDADRVSVGKSKGDHSVPQPQIHELMIAAARGGKSVVRLKGGDPFIFGRGGEELEALQAAGIKAQVVPGISSALGCAASAGLPLTHRDHAQALTFVTGHAKAGGVPDLDWASLARPAQTVVVFMGVGTSASIAEKLIGAGRAPSTPVAVIENGTRPNEIRVFGSLAELPALIERAGIKGPALLVIGEVAGLPAEALADLAIEAVA